MDGVSLVKDHLNISQVISRYTQIRRKGDRQVALCPFHDEKTPSFYLDDKKGLFHCFGCGKGGDMINFVQEIEQMEFREALDFLADLAGLELPKSGYKGPSRDVVEGLRAINKAALDFFHRQLQLKANQPARQYLINRDIKDSTVNLFRLGYAPNQWDGLLNHLSKSFDPALLQKSGLFKQSKRGKSYDIFRNRIMFPIFDAYGNPVAFGGRELEKSDGPKYINSPETPIYTKGKHLYNLNFAKPYLKRKATAVVVEGYMDVIQVYQAGIGAVVAGLGTAFTKQQGKLIKRYAEKVLLNFDGDRAGFKAARETIETLLGLDVEMGVISLPDNLDPDDFIKQNGVEAYRGQMDGAQDFFAFLLHYLSGNQDWQNNPRLLSHIAQELSQTITCIEDPVVRSFYRDRLGDELRLQKSVVQQVFHDAAQEKAKAEKSVRQPVQKKAVGRRQPGPKAPPSFNGEPEPIPPPPGFDDFGESGYHDDTGANEQPSQAGYEQQEQPQLKPFNLMEQQFLYHVMHQPTFAKSLPEDQRGLLPDVLRNYFYDRPWMTDFVFDQTEDFNTRLQAVPPVYHPLLRNIYFKDELRLQEEQQFLVLFEDLLRIMLHKLREITHQRLQHLPPGDPNRAALRRQKFLYDREYTKLGHR